MSMKKIATKNVITIGPKATILEAAKKMREFHVGDLIVIPDSMQKSVPLGILTDRDIVMSTVAFGVAPDTVYVEDVMAPTLVTAKTNDNFYHVLNLMKEHGIRRIPLVDGGGTVAGIVCADDILATLAGELNDVAKITEKQRNVEVSRRKKFA